MKWPRSGFKLFRYRQYCKHKSRFILFYCYKKCQKVWILNRKSWPSWLLSQSLEWGTAKVKDVQKKDLPFKVKKNLLYSMLIPLALAASASFPRNPNEPAHDRINYPLGSSHPASKLLYTIPFSSSHRPSSLAPFALFYIIKFCKERENKFLFSGWAHQRNVFFLLREKFYKIFPDSKVFACRPFESVVIILGKK